MSKVLRNLVNDLVLEHMIEEKFGQKIGEQPALPGVADERDDVNESDWLEEMYPGADIDLGETEDNVDEVTPPGRESQVKVLKKNPEIDNPWGGCLGELQQKQEGLS